MKKALFPFLAAVPLLSFTAAADEAGFDEITPPQERAIEKGLEYLARTQNPDGGWAGPHRVASTALAGLAFLAHGDTPTQGKYAGVLRKTVRFLVSQSDSSSGLICDNSGGGHSPIHEHGYAMLFLGQAYGMTGSSQENERIKSVLVKGVRLGARSQSAAGGWYYTPDANSEEGSTTITMVEGLRSAMDAGVLVDKKVISKAIDLIKNTQNPDGSVNYRPGMVTSSPALTAAGVTVVFNAGDYNPNTAKIIEKGLKFLDKVLKQGNVAQMSNFFFYSHLYMVQCTYLAGKPYWQAYFPQIRKYLLSNQGSDGSWQAGGGGGVTPQFNTAVACVILQVPYRFLPILQK